LLDSALAALDDLLGLDHTMVFLAEGSGLRLAASRGYSCHSADCPGIVVELGAGIVGTAAERRTAVLLRGLGGGLSYGRAIRSQAAGRTTAPLQAEVALPGMVDAQVQLALPMIVGEQLVGVLVAESANPLAFDEWDEVFLQIVANEIAMRLTLLAGLGGPPSAPNPQSLQSPPPADRTQVRRFTLYRNDDCVFVDGEYLVRNVPGRILWKMLRRFQETGQDEFANREFRLDPSLGLPRYRDNLESRLILLRRRLEERCADVRMVPTRRGRFRLELAGPIALEERDSA
jgi:putative methionine-R-sulfoxide reductase with GAF domain